MSGGPRRLILPLLLGFIIFWPSQQGFWLVSVILVLAAEYTFGPTGGRVRERLLARFPAIMMAASVALSVSLLPKAVSQLGLITGFVAWRYFFGAVSKSTATGLIGTFLVQIVFFEAIFLAAAIAGTPAAVVLVVVWLGCFGLAYQLLQVRGDRNSVLMASVWALVAAEISWVFTTWLVSYVTVGSYIIVPQPALVLSAIAYCFGGIYLAQRQNKLSRARLSEYMTIVLVVLVIVITGTKWQGSL